ncbi:xanthine dehydrogenase family protein molybdopterin-binding subunit [Prosthecomicrobium pneumaticum]|uniref:Xanthine dehydrogenase YagR molybdenum-binding subunit n=1 Tax=Prosthecomicrobium pneumaticum TaxID=81895 RepID=A0A7W9FLZ1_9HYPH|nr:xanthine dehydrogenase family protein molybdopterin-binding subunit [Prosthecomicrobium pneumaticum]MBB5753122.1 xanthine dehydrogenase YagR molybdenum-binding subunit [Prosthecomicrobium pneumaticum]
MAEGTAPISPEGAAIGRPIARDDGVAKVTGRARYAADCRPPGLLHAVIAPSRIARGRVTAFDLDAAMAEPGVVAVMTPANRPPLAEDPDAKTAPIVFRLDLLQDDRIRYAGQPVAVVIGETLEAAEEGAFRLAPAYAAEPALVDIDAAEPFVPETVGLGAPVERRRGDVEAALATAAHRVQRRYETAAQVHNPLEPHAVVAVWEGDRLWVDTPSQNVARAQRRIAGLLGLPPDHVHIRSPFVGGGFGAKAFPAGPQVLGILAARLVGRPVKLVLSRAQMFGAVGHRAPTRQTLRLGLADDGTIAALAHHARVASSRFDDFFEPAAALSGGVYAAGAVETTHEAVRLDIATPVVMRGPGEATGSLALECAIDEAAAELGLDPLAFRRLNHADTEPISGRPFSSKALRACYDAGAARFGWAGRPLAPRSLSDSDGRLVGLGIGTAVFPSMMFQAEARALLRADGAAIVELGAHEIGQGAATALRQIAADALGLPLSAVTLRTGASDLPDAGGAAGSSHTATAGSAIHAAGTALVARLAALATADPASPLHGAGNAVLFAADGALHAGDGRRDPHAAVLARAGLGAIEARGAAAPDRAARASHAMAAHGAVFAEVAVDPDLGAIRVTRLVGAFAAGRIVNPRLARSQLVGGMIWGLSLALHEAAQFDPATGAIANADLGAYRIPVHADLPFVEALLVAEEDTLVNPLGVKGVGEIGITGTAGAVANAVWHATGVRIRRFPIRIEDLALAMPGREKEDDA